MKNRILSVLTTSALFSLHSFAQTGGGVDQSKIDGRLGINTITTALPFMAITPDSRAGAMGDAGTALTGNPTSIYWNTSMLIFAPEKSGISVSYTPWLRNLTNDMHLSYVSGYSKIGSRHVVGGALRYFNLGEITYTTDNAAFIRTDKPSEFELTGSYAIRLGERVSLGVNGKFGYSNLTGGMVIEGVDSKAAIVGAADLSFTYFNDQARWGKVNGDFTFAATINNIGNKVSYSNTTNRDFIPTNLKLATSYKAKFDKFNTLLFAFEVQKLLVPTPAIYANIDGERRMIAGHSSDVGVIKGMIQSFYDAPGKPIKDDEGYVLKEDGTAEIQKGSRFKEEMSEINIALGLEYWYNNLVAIRAGYFYESRNKGDRQFLTFGAGLKYNKFGLDISYLAAVGGRRSPLANTVRFTLYMNFGDKKAKTDEGAAAKPE